MSTCILWFRNNLRISDNAPVAYAYANFENVIPVILWESTTLETIAGPLELGAHRVQFLRESISDLSSRFEQEGSKLYVLDRKEVDLVALAQEMKANAIVGPSLMAYNETQEEVDISQRASAAGIQTKWLRERTLYMRSALPFDLDGLPDVFTKFRKLVEKRSRVEHPIEEVDITPLSTFPELIEANWSGKSISLDERSAAPFSGGAKAAWDQIDYYIWENELILSYKETRNGLLGRDYSSKLSPYLALGCVSPREVFHEIQRFEDEIEANDSTYWLFFELLWREYFQWVALKNGKDLFLPLGLQKEKPFKGGFNAKAFERWTTGTTGDDFVDANMKELAATGFMSNRGRQNVASYLVHDMGLDWRAGASYFESQLIDYDPASNYGNWLYNAGRGNDPRPFRKFNTTFQAERYDPDGKFIDAWL